MRKISLFLGLIILAAAIFLGFNFYIKSQVDDKYKQSSQEVSESSLENEASSPGTKRSLQRSKTVNSTNELDISGCNPVPKQLDLKLGQEFQVKNTDSIPRTIIIDSAHQYIIPASSSKTLSSTFGSSGIIGTIGYRCDNKSSEGFAGTFHISE